MPTQPTGPSYLETPLRRRDMEHNYYSWRDTWSSPRLNWGPETNLGVWIQMAVEWFPMNISRKPFLPVGAPYRAWPDSEVYTQRDYGLRVGIFRMMDALQARNIPVSAFMNARVAKRYPILMREILVQGYEIVAAGLDAGAIHHEGLAEDEERAMIAETLAIFESFGVKPSTWHSPSWSQSTRTARLLAEAGLEAMADWGNDEAPYLFNTGKGDIVSLPAAFELCDRDMIHTHKHRQNEVESAMIRAAKRLAREARETGQGRLLTINVSPWLLGQPYRAATFERILDGIFAEPDIRAVTVPDIMAATIELQARG
jgi:peptidoglycan/xylan/chitin deacetylase (PgdA/CDA1 family)